MLLQHSTTWTEIYPYIKYETNPYIKYETDATEGITIHKQQLR